MDPVTVFSLVCGVIQVVQFSAKVLSTAKDLYEKGSLAEHEDMDFMSERLIKLRSELSTRRDECSNTAEEPGQKAILDLAGRCSQTALELHDKLEKLRVANRGSKREAFKKSFKTLWMKKDLEKLGSALDSYQRVLNTNILVKLNQDFNTLAATQSDQFRNLDKSLLDLLTQEKLTFERITTYLDRTSQSTHKHISKEFEQLRMDTARDKYRTEFLANLHFPEIRSRQEGIKDTYKETFQWVFDQSDKALRPWANFMSWLEEGSGFYWINGKAGSGKSTLMNYIQSDPRTLQALQMWAGQNQLVIPVFFFWAAGTELQKSICGLLRSLIYQISENNPQIIDHIIEQGDVGLALGERYLPTAWTERRLGQCFSKISSKTLHSHSICLFVDGLDEFDGDHHTLIDLLEEVVAMNANLKCCVSSRPERPFDRFQGSPMLKLQDLTRNDIRTFVSSSLSRHTQNEQLNAKISKTIVDKADGVFLWADLVVKEGIKGLRNKDDEDVLLERLRSLPPKIDELYSNMLSRIDKVYHTEAANYIQLTSLLSGYSSRRSTVFNFSISLNAFDDKLRLKSLRTDPQPIIDACHLISERIAIVCGGFLDLQKDNSYAGDFPESGWLAWRLEESDMSDTSFDWSRLAVQFSHRTASEFFKSNGAGIELMQANHIQTTKMEILWLAIRLARVSMCQHEEPRDYMHDNIYSILDLLYWKGEFAYPGDFSGPDDFGYEYPDGFAALDYFNQSIADLDLEFNGPKSRGFWFRRWGPAHGDERYRAIFMYSFSDTGRDIVWPKDGSTPAWFPTSFLGVATFFKLYEYASFKIQERATDITKEEIIQLMACMTDCGPESYIDQGGPLPEAALRCICQLLRLGARFGIQFPEKLWRMFWLLIIEMKAGISPDFIEPTEVEEAIGLFLESGADPFPTLLLQAKIRSGSDDDIKHVNFLFEVNMALLPCIYTTFGNIQEQKWREYVPDQPNTSKVKGLKIRIKRNINYSTTTLLGENVMTNEDVRSFYHSFEAILVAADEEVSSAKKKFFRTLVSIYQQFAPNQGNEWPQIAETKFDSWIWGAQLTDDFGNGLLIDILEDNSEDDSEQSAISRSRPPANSHHD